jgi:hypothetical protein
MLDLGLYLTYALIFIAVASMIVFPIFHMLREPSAILRSAIGIGVVVVLFVIAYVIADSEVTIKAAALGITPTTSKLIGAGLIMFYITLILSIIGLIYSEISKALK